MHFCSPSFRLSKAPKRSAIPASGNSEKHVALQYCLPSDISGAMRTWIAVPRRAPTSNLHFSTCIERGEVLEPCPDSCNHKDIVELHLLTHGESLTLSQQCADWFILRQLRVTRTSAAKIIFEENSGREMLGLRERGLQYSHFPSTEQILCDFQSRGSVIQGRLKR
jgi:hypothetical protein